MTLMDMRAGKRLRNMKHSKWRTSAATVGVIGLLAVLAACGTGGSGGASDAGTQTLRLGHVFSPGSTQYKAAENFAKRVEAETGGAITVDVFPAGQLGGDEDMGERLTGGSLDLAFLNAGSMAAVDPLLDFHDLPYIAQSYETVDELFYGDGVIPTTLTQALADQKIRKLAQYEVEFRAVTNNVRPVEAPEDLQGLKLRVPGSLAIRGFFDDQGAQTLVMPFTELVAALEQGTVDGQDNGCLLTTTSGLTKSQEHFTFTKQAYTIGAIAASESVVSGLSEDQQETLKTVAEEVAADQVAQNRKRVEECLDSLEDKGMTVTELSPETMAKFVKSGRSLWNSPKFQKAYGEDRLAKLRAEVNAAEN